MLFQWLSLSFLYYGTRDTFGREEDEDMNRRTFKGFGERVKVLK